MTTIFHDNCIPPVDSPRRVFRRIVAVQGAVQLTSALAAIRTSTRKSDLPPVENHLIVHDLSSPGDQVDAFASCLMRLAEKAEGWTSMHFFPLAEILRFQKALKAGSWERATATLCETLGFAQCDELLLGQNLLFLNKLLHFSFPSSQTACYGDGIGLNFSDEYYKPTSNDATKFQSLGRSIERWIRFRIKALRGIPVASLKETGKSKKLAVPFKKHYLLLANQFDQTLDRFEQVEADDFRELFSIFARDMDQEAKSTCASLEAALKPAADVVVLLTSNFSETKRMSLDGEVHCSMEMLRRRAPRRPALLVIKPHPRDSLAKIQALELEASKLFQTIVTLSDTWSFFIPFESIFERYFLSDPAIARKTRIVCSSSACISLEYLYGQPCELGFGPKNVQRYFDPKWRELRQRHESDLIRIIESVRRMGLSRRAA